MVLLAVIIWALVGFASGSVMWAWLLGRWFGHVDLRESGDGNPGAGELAVAAGMPLGVTAALLDYAKALVPVALALRWVPASSWGIVPIALAPVLGHAYSPMLRGRGGKSLACTFGVWTALLGFGGPIALGAMIALLAFVFETGDDAWAIQAGMLAVLATALLRPVAFPVAVAWLGNEAVLLSRYWPQFLAHPLDVRLRPGMRAHASRRRPPGA